MKAYLWKGTGIDYAGEDKIFCCQQEADSSATKVIYVECTNFLVHLP